MIARPLMERLTAVRGEVAAGGAAAADAGGA